MRFDLIEDAYPLSPLQEGLLFHTLFTPEDAVYVEQSLYPLQPDFDPDAFERAWQRVIDRHTALRTSFHWEALDQPIQVVQSSVKVKIDRHNWSDTAADQLQDRMNAFLLEDRRQAFDLSSAPVVRLALIQTDRDTWYFCLTFHHILLDRWSVSLALDEVFSYYAADREGTTLDLPPAPTFGSYVEWIQKQDPASTERFWRKALDGFTAPTQLPADIAPSGEHRSKAARTELLWLSDEDSATLRDFARARQLTTNTLVQGAWALLLSRYSGQQRVLFGAAVTGRPPDLPDSDKIVGLLINTVPVPVIVSPNLSVTSWLKRLQEHLTDIREHDYSSLAQIQSWSAIPSGVPLFESIATVYNLPQSQAKNAPVGKESQKGPDLRSSQLVSGDHYPLTFQVAPGPRLGMNITYDANRFSAETIKRMLTHLRQILLGMALQPQENVSAVFLLTEAERHLSLVEWNDTKADFPKDRCTHTLFEEQVARTPDSTAVVCGTESITYSELNARANQLAHYLKKQGVGRATLVGLCVDRSVEMVVGMLGILKAGGAYLPLDPSHPASRLEFMLKDAGANWLVSDRSTLDALPGEACQVVCLDKDRDAIASQNADNPSCVSSAEDLIYVMYTSGSTGIPKGIEIPHRAVNRLLCGTNYVSLGPDRTMAQLANAAFDASTWEVWGALVFGAKLVILPRDEALSPDSLREKLKESGVRELFLTTALFNQIAEHAPEAFDDLEDLLFGGERVDILRVRSLLARRATKGLGPKRLLHVYGPTESTTYASSYEVQQVDDSEATVPIGRPLANTQIYLLDTGLQPVPVGVAGEVYIGGSGLARGYLNRPDLTAEKFIPDPFGGDPGGRLYRTGDLARHRPDGRIEFLGRTDHQVKVRGFRIELGEIETALLSLPGVKETVVVAREDSPGEKRLVGYVVGDGASELSVGSLRDGLRVSLPEYMVPAFFVILDSLPVNPNGKVDRKALPDPDMSLVSDADALDPRSPIEAGIAQIWSDVLRIPSIGVHDNFFENGGHSLLATQVISRMRSTFQVDLPLRTIFDFPTVELLARCVIDSRRQEAVRTIPELKRAHRGARVPLSFAQQRLWFIDQLNPGLAAYNIPIHMRLCGPLDRPALQRALQEIVKRHEILRTNFVAEGSEVSQVISDDAGLPLSYNDLTGLSEELREAEARRLCLEQADMPFDLAADRLIRALLIGLSENDNVLAITAHHIICDGWSINIFLKELTGLYEAFREEKPSPLTDLPIQYADYAIWQREWLQGEELERQAAYWRAQLAGAPRLLNLPTDRPRESAASYHGDSETMVVPPDECRELKSLCSDERTSLFMGLLAVFDILLHCYTRQDDIVVGTDEAGRNQRATEALIGFFINHLVLRADLSGNPTFRELLGRVRETTLDAYTHSDLPFDKLVSLIQPDREASHTPLFHVLFVMQPSVSAATTQNSLKISGFGGEANASKYDIVLFVREGSAGLATTWVYRTDLFDPSTIRAMASDFEVIAGRVAASPDTPLADIKALLLDLAAQRSSDERAARRSANRPRLRPDSGSL